MAERKHRQPKAPATPGFQSTLTRELCDLLCETHESGKDFRNQTAVRCGVHPRTLTRWLKLGASDENAGFATELFMRMGKAEGDFRAELLKEIADPTADTVEVSYDEEHKVCGKTTTTRRVSGLTWLLEHRFRQFRPDNVPGPDDLEIALMLQPEATVYSLDMVLGIVQQMAAHPERLPEAVRRLFAETDWGVPQRMTDGQVEPQH